MRALLLLLAALCMANCSDGIVNPNAIPTTAPLPSVPIAHAPPLIPTGQGATASIPSTGPALAPTGIAGHYSVNTEDTALAISSYSSGTPVISAYFAPSSYPSTDFVALGKPSLPAAVDITAPGGNGFITVSGGADGFNLRNYSLLTLSGGFIAAVVGTDGNPIILNTSVATFSGCVQTTYTTEQITTSPAGTMEYIVNLWTSYAPASATGAAMNACPQLFTSGNAGPFFQAVSSAGGIDATRAAQIQALGLSFYYVMSR